MSLRGDVARLRRLTARPGDDCSACRPFYAFIADGDEMAGGLPPGLWAVPPGASYGEPDTCSRCGRLRAVELAEAVPDGAASYSGFDPTLV